MNPRVRQATILVNRMARGVARRFDPGAALGHLLARGVDAHLVEPSSPGEAVIAAADSARRGDALLFVAGGDGTLRQAAGGLAGSSTALAPLAAGTANVLARELRIPRDPLAAIDIHLQGQRVAMDLGRAAAPGEGPGQPFLLTAGIGWDAAIAARVSPALKARLGIGAYLLEAARGLPRKRAAMARWSWDGGTEERPLAVLIAGNTRLYGGLVSLTPAASATDGMLDFCALCPARRGQGLGLAAGIAFRRPGRGDGAWQARLPSLTIETPGLPVQLDGDTMAETPLVLSVEPRALLVSLPAGPLPAILGPAGPWPASQRRAMRA